MNPREDSPNSPDLTSLLHLDGPLEAFLPANLAGRSVLIYGKVSSELIGAIRSRGAQVIVGGVSASRLDSLYQGSGDLGLEPCDIERKDFASTYDFVLCARSLTHFRNPLAVLERLVLATRDSLFVAISRPPSMKRWTSDVSVLLAPLAERLPGMFLIPSRRKRSLDQGFSISLPLVEAYFKSMRQDFASIEVLPGTAASDTVVLARKRHIGKLLILAGVNAVGKSTFLDKLRSNAIPDTAAALDIDTAKPWQFTTYAHLLKNSDLREHPYLLVQYNITAPFVHGKIHGHHHGILDLISRAEEARVATFWLDPEVQRSRYYEDRVPQTAFTPGLHAKRKVAKHLDVHGRDAGFSEKSVTSSFFYVRSGYTRRKADRLLSLYGDSDNFIRMYDEWFDFAESNCRQVKVIYQDPGYRVGTVDEWRKLVEQRTWRQAP